MIPHAINGKIQLFRHFFCPYQGIDGNEFENLILFQKHPHVCGEDQMSDMRQLLPLETPPRVRGRRIRNLLYKN